MFKELTNGINDILKIIKLEISGKGMFSDCKKLIKLRLNPYKK